MRAQRLERLLQHVLRRLRERTKERIVVNVVPIDWERITDHVTEAPAQADADRQDGE